MSVSRIGTGRSQKICAVCTPEQRRQLEVAAKLLGLSLTETILRGVEEVSAAATGNYTYSELQELLKDAEQSIFWLESELAHATIDELED